MSRPGPPELHTYDPRWRVIAEKLIAELRTATDAPAGWTFDHIGSTSVPGLAAKAIIDLQIRVPALPERAELDTMLDSVGYVKELGARPDSPGVYRDTPRGTEGVPADVWQKYLYTRNSAPPVVLHIRQKDSPFGWYTVWFRDWLRSHDERRDEYAATKLKLVELHADDDDYDDYTRDKGEFFDQVHPIFERWAEERG